MTRYHLASPHTTCSSERICTHVQIHADIDVNTHADLCATACLAIVCAQASVREELMRTKQSEARLVDELAAAQCHATESAKVCCKNEYMHEHTHICTHTRTNTGSRAETGANMDAEKAFLDLHSLEEGCKGGTDAKRSLGTDSEAMDEPEAGRCVLHVV